MSGFFLTLLICLSSFLPQLVRQDSHPQATDRATENATAQRIEVSRDLWISAVPQEQEGNNGESPRLKLKGVQEFFLIDFDPQPFQGRQVVKAQLHLHLEGEEILQRTTISSIAVPWEEGDGTNYSTTTKGSSFRWQFGEGHPWPGDSGDITGVTLGQMNTLWGFSDPTPPDEQKWQIVEIDPKVVQARIDGNSHGFFVIDDVGSEYVREGNRFEYRVFPNRFFSSRQSNRSRAPFFTVWFADGSVLTGLPLVSEGESSSRDASPLPSCLDLYGSPLPRAGLSAARGEAVCFFVACPPELLNVTGADQFDVQLFRSVEVDGEIDPLVPASIPLNEIGLTHSGRIGPALVEIYVPKHLAAGRYEIKLSFPAAAGGDATAVSGDTQLTIPVTVWDFQLPDQLTFIPQMNCYDLPEGEIDYFKLAHQHRLTLNQLRYGWSGKVDAETIPQRTAANQWDWTKFDRQFGPLFDGSAFKGLRRDSVPVEAWYLPFNENWPMNHEAHFQGGYWIENAYSDQYWQEFRNIVEEFDRHFVENNWDRTMFEFYLNNKVYHKASRNNRWDASSAAWVFDEPSNTQDFWALRRFGLEFRRALQESRGNPELIASKEFPQMKFRIDVSRPEWQRDLLDGVSDVEVISGSLRQYHNRIRLRQQKNPLMVYMYGSANKIGTPNWYPVAWSVEAWSLGADGVVPWQTIGNTESWTKRDELSLFYPSAQGPVPSIRLKAFRAGQQLVEYLTLYQQDSGVPREKLMETLRRNFKLPAQTIRRNEDDAGSSEFNAEIGIELNNLRSRLGQYLNSGSAE